MPNLSQNEIVAAVAEKRMTAQQAYELLRTADEPYPQPGPTDRPVHFERIVVTRSWSQLEASDPRVPDSREPGLILVAPGAYAAHDVSRIAGAESSVVIDLPTLPGGASGDQQFADFWEGRVVARLHASDELSVVFSAAGATTTNPDTALLFRLTQAVLRTRTPNDLRIVFHVLRSDDRALAWAQGCASFMRCVHLENPRVSSRVVLMDRPLDATTYRWLARATASDVPAPGGGLVRVDDRGQCWVLDTDLDEPQPGRVPVGPGIESTAFVITGGTGGLARVLAPELVRRGAPAVVLCGRRRREQLDAGLVGVLERGHGAISYVSSDLGSDEEVMRLLGDARATTEGLCVVHAAGVRNDAFVIKQDVATFLETAAPKTDLLDMLMAAVRRVPGALLVAFSSVAALLGNPGQSAYAFANGYMDGLALDEPRRGDGGGRFLSIGWPLWDEGGMRIDGQAQDLMRSRTGMVPLGTDAGVDFLLGEIDGGRTGSEALLWGVGELIEDSLRPGGRAGAGGQQASGVVAGDIRGDRPPTSTAPVTTLGVASEELHRRTCRFLVQVISSVTEIPASDIVLDEPFDQFGLDSIVAMRIGDELERNFDGLPKTLLFEYQSINELAGYFTETHAQTLGSLLGIDPQPRPPAERDQASPVAEPVADERSGSAPIPAVAVVDRPVARQTDPRPARQETDGIAIVGLAGRYPQAESVEEFWQNLVGGVDSITEIPETRWDREEFFSAKKGELGRTNSRWGGFLDGIDQFDPRLFHINAREAAIMDPQERLFLETVWTAVEDAGYCLSDLRGRRVAVFAGAMYTEYQMLPSYAEGRLIAHSSLHSSIANRVSYYFDLNGPSVALDTMCSSSLVAVHYACRAILDGEAAMAIAGGVNVSLTPEKYLFLSQGNFLSSDGRCRAFGAGGDGYVPSEGVGAVVLKRVTDAVRDGDHIYGVIRGSAVNHDGKTSGYTVPSPKAQADVISRALAAGAVDPARVSYVEAHGTGTELGDPIEISGLSQVYAASPPAGGRATRAIGSVKSNIGHAESAAGIASLTKVLLQLQHAELVPSIHADQLNPIIDFASGGFTVQRAHEPWEASGDARRLAGISCFGAGGTNCHLVVEEYPGARLAPSEDRRVFVPFSSASEEQLRALLEKFVKHLRTPAGRSLRMQDVAYTMQRGRERMRVSLVVFARDTDQLVARIEDFLARGQDGPDLIYRASPTTDPDTDFFFAGELGRELIGRLVEQRQMDQLARIWLKGLPIEVERLYDDCRRVSLPTYVFDHASYWIPQEPKRASAGGLTDVLDSNDSDLDGVRLTATFDAGPGRKARFVDERGEVSAFAGAHAAEDSFRQLTGQAGDTFSYLRFLTRAQGPAPITYAVRAARGGLGVIVETTGPDGGVVFQASTSAAGERPVEELPERLRRAVDELVTRREAGDPQAGSSPVEVPGVDDARVHILDAGVDDLGSPLSAILAGCVLALGGQAGRPGLLEVTHLELLSSGRADVAVDRRASVGSGQDLEFYNSPTGRLIARVSGVTLAGETREAAGVPAVEPGVLDVVRDRVTDDGDVEGFVLDISADLFGVPRERLDTAVPFDEYGMDSVLIGRFAERIRTRFPQVQDTVLFDNATIGGLVDHLRAHYASPASGIGTDPDEPPTAAPAAGLVEPGVRPVRAAAIPSLIRGATHTEDEPVAIIGMSGVFPEAPDLGAYWHNLLCGREAISTIPIERWDYRPFFDAETDIPRPGTVYAPWGGFVDDPFGFDNRFFNITPADAVVIDPQERMLLETVWHTLEDAGVTRSVLTRPADDDLQEDVGVFVGTTSQTYQFWGVEESLRGRPVLTNASPWSLANRVSYFFDFSGPSMPVDTACSSGLSAVHLAMESLRSGECTSAIAAGVNLFLHPLKYVSMCQMKMLSPTGRLSAFGADADGFVPGEGVAAVLLKPLSKALADGDRVRALIRSSAVNHGGKTNGYTVPSVSAQARLLRRGWERAAIDPASIGYLEMHGTGTRLGDPIEVEAAARAMAASTDRRRFCAIGSVKANIGHLESCSGLASLIKVVRQMETRTLAPTINASPLNPRLELENGPFFITEQQLPWEPDERSGVLRAGISSFGAGGSNAHIVVESFAGRGHSTVPASPQLIVLSARTDDRLPLMAELLADHLERQADVSLADVAWTLQTGREPLAARLAFVASDVSHCVAVLRQVATGAVIEGVARTPEGTIGQPESSPAEVTRGRADEQSLGRLAQAWTRKAHIDWDSLHGRRPGVVSLPEYPFEHTHYVVEHGVREPLAAIDAERVERTVRERREDRAVDEEIGSVHPQTSTYVPVWDEFTDDGRPAKSWEGRVVTVFADETFAELSDALANRLREHGATVSVLDMQRWAEADRSVYERSTDIVHLPQPRRAGGDDIWSLTALESEQEQALLGFLGIVRRVMSRGATAAGCDLYVVTDRVHDLAGVSRRPYGGGASALLRSAVKEGEGFRGVAIDFDLSDTASHLDEVCSHVLGTACTEDVEELLVRDGRAHVLRLAGSRLPLAGREPIAPGSVHVIVGGLGSVGFAYADHLVHACHARVCLVGRSPLSADTRRLLARLGDSGVHYLYRAVDATDDEALRAVLEEVVQRWGAVDGLVHSAMVFDETAVADMSEETFRSVLRPKTRVVQAMLKAARGLEIGHVLAFSSSQTYLGTRHRAHYAAACASLRAYLDAAREALGVSVHRIDWGFWGTDKGRRIDRSYEDFLAVRGVRPIGEHDGMDVVMRVLSNSLPETTVLTVSERVKSHIHILTEAGIPGSALEAPPGESGVRRAPRRAPAGDRPQGPQPGTAEPGQERFAEKAAQPPEGIGDVEAQLVRLLAEVISASEADIDPSASFMDIGLDSISGLKFVRAVADAWSIDLGDTVVFDFPTIASLSEHILDTYGDQLRASHAEPPRAGANPTEPPQVADEDHSEVFALFKMLESREMTPDDLMAMGDDDHAL
ncbi:SDR family NAD(P)-dependent oxidoreductase [Brooklawnia cerclae]|uniref:Polyketide synthase PksL n=1 Tax=Brooklawnia cerclae TaxID=349934 RepID=A0ABX0SIY8_9ACTN|nr:SDR family NAD(P)-dependent oxidoreductase [Brooklawnia cerclae]NIH56606.1 polyketide synthase PksL [Brooklawnia cerclae]